MTALVQSTEIDYYSILGVTRQSSLSQICKAYREIALKTHPSLQHQNKNQAYHRFCQASQAFDVLYDNQKRSIYDKYGQQVLKEGLIQQGSLSGNYKFTVDPQQTFQKFFGSKNVYEHLLNLTKQDNLNHPIFSNPYSDQIAKKNVKNLIVPVQCTLTQLFNGCTKNLSYTKFILTQDEQSVIPATQFKTIQFLPGAGSQNKIVYKGQGNKEPGYPQSDLIFEIKQVNQKNFIREGANLIYTAHISLMDALDSKTIQILQLNGQILHVHFDQIISPQTKRTLIGKGMPIQNKQERGDLIVKFDIQFPDQLSIDKKRQIVTLLKCQ